MSLHLMWAELIGLHVHTPDTVYVYECVCAEQRQRSLCCFLQRLKLSR